MQSEAEPLLGKQADGRSTISIKHPVNARIVPDQRSLHGDDEHGEEFDNVPRARRQLGLTSVTFLVFNRVIGTGIFATPSVILRSAGSVGVALLMWLAGALIAAAGTAVYLELGSGIPRSGGEKNYLEFIYRRPRFLVTCVYAVWVIITGAAAANSVVFGQYVLHALGFPPTHFNVRFCAFLCLSFILVMHGRFSTWGVRLQNSLGLTKLFILSAIALFGAFTLMGVPGFEVRDEYEKPHNFRWQNFWEGSGTGVNAFVTGLYNVVWSFIGYSNANYVLSEVKNPIKTIKRAAPLAMLLTSVLYILVNIGYFSVVSKTDILGSRQIIAALFFRNIFGNAAERVLSAIIAISALGNLLSSQFAQGRVVQELGREGVLPFSFFFASSKPFNSPFAGLFGQYLISTFLVFAPPPGDLYLFIINTSSFCNVIINTLVSAGLLLLYTRPYRSYEWNPPLHAHRAVIVVFFLSNLFLIVVPLIPPLPGNKLYERLPYWGHVAMGYSVSLLGVLYWYVWSIWLPRRRGYVLERVPLIEENGISRIVFRKIPVEG